MCNTDKCKECLFTNVKVIRQSCIMRAVQRCIEHYYTIRPWASPPLTDSFRPVLLMGHGIKNDLPILDRLWLDISGPHITGVLDTEAQSHRVLPQRDLSPSSPYELGDTLCDLGCPHDRRELHNAGNGATYTIFAALYLAVKVSREEELRPSQVSRRSDIERFTQNELDAPRLPTTPRPRLASSLRSQAASASSPQRRVSWAPLPGSAATKSTPSSRQQHASSSSPRQEVTSAPLPQVPVVSIRIDVVL